MRGPFEVPVPLLALALPADTQTLVIAVALLIAAALLIALLARVAVGRRAPKPPSELPPPKPAERPEPPRPPAPVTLPPARAAREQRARDELRIAEDALAAAEARLSSDAATRAEVDRRRREVSDAQRKVEYERRKLTEAEERARRDAEVAARTQAEAAARTAEEARLAAERAAHEEARRKLAEAEAGRTLAKTRSGFMARLNAFVGAAKELDDSTLAELEEILFSADVGVRTATRLLESVRERLKRRELSDVTLVKAALREEVERILSLGVAPGESGHGGLPDLPPGTPPPDVVMVVGVNGTGKTTTIGKLAARLKHAGKSVILGAGDTFRAAAGEQLDVWADRAGVPMVRGKDGSDPGAVLFDAVARAKAEGVQVVLCDTAGRLHTKANLMEELQKIRRTRDPLTRSCWWWTQPRARTRLPRPASSTRPSASPVSCSPSSTGLPRAA